MDSPNRPRLEEWKPLIRTIAGIADVARFVSSDAIADLGWSVADAGSRRAEATSVDLRVAANRASAEEIFSKMLDRDYRYTPDDPWSLDARQQHVRPPEELDRYAGTCLDFAVAYASACLHAKIAPLILLGGGHAWVGLDLGRAPDKLGADLELDSTLRFGLVANEYRFTTCSESAVIAHLLGSSRYDYIDVAMLGAGYADAVDFAAARRQGRALVEQRKPYVIDVAMAQARGQRALPADPVGATASNSPSPPRRSVISQLRSRTAAGTRRHHVTCGHSDRLRRSRCREEHAGSQSSGERPRRLRMVPQCQLRGRTRT